MIIGLTNVIRHNIREIILLYLPSYKISKYDEQILEDVLYYNKNFDENVIEQIDFTLFQNKENDIFQIKKTVTAIREYYTRLIDVSKTIDELNGFIEHHRLEEHGDFVVDERFKETLLTFYKDD